MYCTKVGVKISKTKKYFKRLNSQQIVYYTVYTNHEYSNTHVIHKVYC